MEMREIITKSYTSLNTEIREMTVRHLFTKLKPQMADFLESWTNYTKVNILKNAFCKSYHF